MGSAHTRQGCSPCTSQGNDSLDLKFFHNFCCKQKLTLAGSLFRRYAPFTASLLATSLQSNFTFAIGKNFTTFALFRLKNPHGNNRHVVFGYPAITFHRKPQKSVGEVLRIAAR